MCFCQPEHSFGGSSIETGPAHLESGSAMAANWSIGFESFIEDYSDVGSNDSCLLQELPYAHIFMPTLNFITFFTGFFGNLYVILLMARKQGSKRLVDTFVLNLAVADLVFVCTLPFWALSVALGYWCFGEVMCKLSSYTISVNRCSSILFLMGMSVERFLVVTKHWDSRSMGTKKSIGVSCGCIWVVSLLLGIPSLVYRKLIPITDTSKSLCQDESSSPTFSLVLLIVTFLLPLGVILFCYCSIFSKLRGHASRGKRRSNALKIIFAIIGAFICFWLPFNTFNTFLIFAVSQHMDLSCPAQMALRWGLTISACLAFTNSCINPIIYVFMDQHFRQQALKNCPIFCSKGSKMQNSALSFSSTESSLLFANKKKFTSATSTQLEDMKGTGRGV
uniref:probable G-protein coupled receptor 25 n=1 Tax=Euleptes europaea TaxID=460621 RepID=UPI002540E4FD|nr:probable G-protein coupled receptor 25 [Euleptes europaea]